jgi:hypothetical protein
MGRVKRILSVFLIVIILIPSTSIAAAAGFRYEAEALILNKLGLFAGVSATRFEPNLGEQLQRQAAVILLVKMFGKEAAAKAMSKSEVDAILSKYEDNGGLAEFARCFMAYAVKTGMVTGTTPTRLGPTTIIDSQSFACMILKNLGYSVNPPNDFIHSLDVLGGLAGTSPLDIARINLRPIIRDDAVAIMYWSLRAARADGVPLIISLIDDGFVPLSTAVELGFVERDAGTGKITLLPKNTTVPTERDAIYGIIRDALANASPSVTIPINSASDTIAKVGAIISDILADDPTILYYTSMEYWPNGLLKLFYTKDAATVRNHRNLLQSKAQSIISGIIEPGMTDYHKELAIHDYLVDNCTYDTTSPKPPAESYTAYGALCLDKAVCEGYAKAMKMLLNQAGIECLFVTGTSRGQNHAWNIVKICNQYYHLDAAWDDTIMADGSAMRIYTYFNLPDSAIMRDHGSWAATLPKCDMTTFNYHEYNSYVARGKDEFVAFAVAQFNKGVNPITVKVSDNDKPGFDLLEALLSIQKATGAKFTMRAIDAYGIVDLMY